MRIWITFLVTLALVGAGGGMAMAAGTDADKLFDPNMPAASVNALVELFVLAVILESALAVLFNWRPFVIAFDGRGIKTLVAVVFSGLLVWRFQLDIVGMLIKAYNPQVAAGPHIVSGAVTALMLAGGSAGVYNVLVKLGIRSPRTDAAPPQPDETKAWLRVGLKRKDASGPVNVEVDQGGGYQTAGVIYGSYRPPGFFSVFVREKGVFPSTGGYTVAAGKAVKVKLTGVKDDGSALPDSREWGPKTLSPRAIVDLVLEL